LYGLSFAIEQTSNTELCIDRAVATQQRAQIRNVFSWGRQKGDAVVGWSWYQGGNKKVGDLNPSTNLGNL